MVFLRNHKLKILFVNLIFCFSLYSQDEGEKPINLHIDFAQFIGNSDATLLEIFYSIPRDVIAHSMTENGFEGKFQFDCKIFYGDSLINTISWDGRDIAESEDKILPNQTINDYHLLLLKPSSYTLEIDFLNNNMNVVYSSKHDLVIKDFNQTDLSLSSLQFCSNIEQSKSNNRFVKNGYQLTLNPSSIFGTERPVLFYYSEIYNLKDINFGSDSTYTLHASISDRNGDVVKQIPAKTKMRMGSSLVQIGQIYIGGLKSGAYNFDLSVTDNSSLDSNRTSKKFFVYRPSDFLAQSDAESEDAPQYPAFLVYSEEELDKEFEYLRYISTSEEKDVYENLNLAGKREFMENFWVEKSELHKHMTSDYRKDYFNLIEFANNRYSAGSKKGWETNPGRIILTYGKPDEMDKFSTQSAMGHYEIWQYHKLQGGVQFVLLDVNGYGDLRLVHSTAIQEIQDYEWQRRYLEQ